jgi:hypothetical protein
MNGGSQPSRRGLPAPVSVTHPAVASTVFTWAVAILVTADHVVLQAMLSDAEQVTVQTATLSCIIERQDIRWVACRAGQPH